MIKNSLVILTLALLFFSSGHAEQKFQSLDSIYEFVKATVARSINAADYEISVLPLDNLLKLPECPKPLEASTPDLIKAGRTTVGVYCNTENKWSISTSAVIKVYENVIVLTRPVQRGEIISRQNIAIKRRDISSLRGDFINQVEQIENKQAAQFIPAGVIVGSRNFIEPRLVKRGDKIVISALQPGFTIRMNGIAMMDGTKGQVIRIKNEKSGRIISGTVIEPGLVSVK
ncbi:MAG: flagellar basal body P-ring formation chaperone FlgA [Methylococcales bacterium]|nr:flagellar basal body P-ring formation chaperone FlgA [Methylococcales bacterium]